MYMRNRYREFHIYWQEPDEIIGIKLKAAQIKRGFYVTELGLLLKAARRHPPRSPGSHQAKPAPDRAGRHDKCCR